MIWLGWMILGATCAVGLILMGWGLRDRTERPDPEAHDQWERSEYGFCDAAPGSAPECETTASCEPGDHTFTWPCAFARVPATATTVGGWLPRRWRRDYSGDRGPAPATVTHPTSHRAPRRRPSKARTA